MYMTTEVKVSLLLGGKEGQMLWSLWMCPLRYLNLLLASYCSVRIVFGLFVFGSLAFRIWCKKQIHNVSSNFTS